MAGRVNPGLIDLAAAIATGAVGAFAVVRSDVSDTLPGVAIAISLVPPLAVVGLTLEARAGDESVGALLMFLTNVGAILITGVLVMVLYHIRTAALASALQTSLGRRTAVMVIVAFVVVIDVALAGSTARIVDERLTTGSVTDVATAWADAAGWEGHRDDATGGGGRPRARPHAGARPGELRERLDAAGLPASESGSSSSPRSTSNSRPATTEGRPAASTTSDVPLAPMTAAHSRRRARKPALEVSAAAR